MNAWLRQHCYALMTTLHRLSAQPFSSLANLLVMALALALPLLGAAILVSVQPLAKELSITPEVTIYLQHQAPQRSAALLAQRIGKEFSEQISAVRVVDRDEALKSLRANPAWAQALAVLPDNPLPDAIVATLNNGDDLADRAVALANEWKHWEHVDQVQLDSAWVQRLEAILHFGRIGLFFLALCVAVVVLATVFNTVRLQALSQRGEIAVARLVGATEQFVRRPFLYLGAVSGALAAILAVSVASLALSPLNQALARLAQSYNAEFSLHLPEIFWLVLGTLGAAALGALSARWSVTRNTRF